MRLFSTHWEKYIIQRRKVCKIIRCYFTVCSLTSLCEWEGDFKTLTPWSFHRLTNTPLPINCAADEYLSLMVWARCFVCEKVNHWLVFKDFLNMPHGWSQHAPFLSAIKARQPRWPTLHGWKSSSVPAFIWRWMISYVVLFTATVPHCSRRGSLIISDWSDSFSVLLSRNCRYLPSQ